MDTTLLPRRLMTQQRRARGQVLPIMGALIGILAVAALFFFNTIGFSSIGTRAMEGAIKQGGLAGLQMICNTDSATCTADFTRWELDGPLATGTVRRFVAYNMVSMDGGDPQSPAGFANLFTSSDLTAVIMAPDGTTLNGTAGARDGLDVELLIPVTTGDPQLPERYYNCDPQGAGCDSQPLDDSACTATNAMYSSLANACFSETTVITRLRLTDVQAGPPATLYRINISKAGTDAPAP